MTITLKTIHDPAARSRATLSVEVSGVSLVVRPGAVRWAGQDYALAEPYEYDLVEREAPADVLGLLVIEKETGAMLVAVDEIVHGEDTPFLFDRASPYALVHQLYTAHVPAGTTAWEDVDVTVFHVEPLQAPALPEPPAPVDVVETPADGNVSAPTGLAMLLDMLTQGGGMGLRDIASLGREASRRAAPPKGDDQ